MKKIIILLAALIFACSPAVFASHYQDSNSATATALAANGTNCGANQAAGGVDASGNAEACIAPVLSEIDPTVDTSAEIVAIIGASVYMPYARTMTKSFVLSSPTTSSDLPLWRVPDAITITHVHVLCVDGTNIIGQLWEYDTNGLNGSTVDADITGTAGSNVDDDGSLTNGAIAAGNYLGWKTTSVAGGPTRVIVTYDYTVN